MKRNKKTMTTDDEAQRRKIRTARWIGIVLVLVLGGAVATVAASADSSVIGWILAVGVLVLIGAGIVARFVRK